MCERYVHQIDPVIVDIGRPLGRKLAFIDLVFGVFRFVRHSLPLVSWPVLAGSR